MNICGSGFAVEISLVNFIIDGFGLIVLSLYEVFVPIVGQDLLSDS